MEPLSSERLDTIELLRKTRAHEPTRGVEDDASADGATRARLDVLEHDVVRLRVLVPRRADDLRPETRVRAQAASRPDRLGVRADLGLREVVGLPVGVQLAGERVPMSGNVGSASLHVIDRLAGWSIAQTPTNGPPITDRQLCHVISCGWMDGWTGRGVRTGYVLSL